MSKSELRDKLKKTLADYDCKDINVIEAIDRVKQYANTLVEEAYKKGYNSGWVKANRLMNPKNLEHFAAQLEKSAKSVRGAIASLKEEL